MKNLSLTVKIWLALSLVSLILYVFVLLIMPPLIRNFFTNTLMEPPVLPPPKNEIEGRGFHVRSFIMLEDGTTLPPDAQRAFPPSFLKEIKQNAELQQSPRQLYESKNKQTGIRYVIVKNMAYGKPLYRVMFLRKPEEDLFVKTFLFDIMLYVGAALLVSWFVSLLIVRYLTRPLTIMEKHVKLIADRNWHEPLDIKRNDEIGKLAKSIDTMRRQLIQQDESQQSMLQNISHELKTPVMVIRSYAQAMQDGVYPRGDLKGSIQVIDEEGKRLEKMIQQLLYLTRLDYLAAKNPVYGNVCLKNLIEEITQRLNLQRPEITWQLSLQPVTVKGDEDTLRVMIENLLDNHLRYAASKLEIILDVNSEQSEVILKFWNDGSQIDPHIINDIFKPFRKGRKGKYGLGLTIVERILKMYQGKIELLNEKNGVSTIVKIPLKFPEKRNLK
ncbi:MAG: HAMP domain-containing histidine kinase [Desulfotomaculum sp.]|nr:HAMP domain-containing histidine kinase [Desulfotomaculum sp.]